ncbi:glycoside hydrolase family 28 protein [Pedobacter sp. AW31-3R]|uniref:glycoside hydrolase family 28 protein n=1 Tax=Pedobacter sp. AW31-3R TaxID=3445781 RepID=UPI003F9F462F
MKLILALTTLFTLSVTTLTAQEFLITDYGAGADSTRLSTKAIQKTIDAAYSKGGGTVVIPKGVYLSGALFFKKNTKLVLLQGATLKGSDQIKDYPLVPSRMEGRKLDYYAALINATKVDGFSITGPGTVDGNGLKFWEQFWAHRLAMKKIGKESTNLEVHRPRLIFIWESNHVSITNITLRNAGFWTTHFYQCNTILMENCDIRSPFKPVPAPSTDGIDLDVCKDVVIRKCYISVNDDAIAIKGGKGPNAHQLPENGSIENVLIEDCKFGNAHATLTLGSECIRVKNIVLRNCEVDNNCSILNLKMRPDTYQVFEDVRVENITGKCGAILTLKPWKQFFDLGKSQDKPFGIVKNISFSDIRVNCASFGQLEGNPNDQVSDISFRNITATAVSPDFRNIYKGLKTENVTLNGKQLIL